MKNWKEIYGNLPSDELDKIAILRVMECTNGVIQHAFRDGAEYALSVDDTRRAMKFSMGCIKRMEIPLGEEVITFDEDLKEIFGEIRDLYISGAKNGNDEDFREFMKISIIMYNVLGKDRILNAQKLLSQHIVEIAPDKLEWGVDYIMQFIK